MTGTSLLLAVLFSAVGAGYFLYGRKQQRGSVLICGIALCLFPYFVSNLFLLVLIGALLMAVPFVLRS